MYVLSIYYYIEFLYSIKTKLVLIQTMLLQV